MKGIFMESNIFDIQLDKYRTVDLSKFGSSTALRTRLLIPYSQIPPTTDVSEKSTPLLWSDMRCSAWLDYRVSTNLYRVTVPIQ